MKRITAFTLVSLTILVILLPMARAGMTETDSTTLVVGPVQDTNGVPLEGAHVDIYTASRHYNGTTNMGGFSIIGVNEDVRNTTLTITVKADGYADVVYTTAVNSTGSLSKAPPKMIRTDTGEVSPYLWLWRVLFVLVIVIIFAVVMYSRTRAEDDSTEESFNDQNK